MSEWQAVIPFALQATPRTEVHFIGGDGDE